MATPAQIRDAILARVNRHAPPTLLFDLIVDVIIALDNVHVSEAQENAEKKLALVFDRIGEYIVDRNDHQRDCAVCFSDSETPYLQGVDYIFQSDDQELAAQKLARKSVIELTQKIRVLSPTKFESLMGEILNGLGLKEVTITNTSGDDGVDFYGRVNLGDFTNRSILPDHFLNEVEVLVVGQAKRYARSKFKLSDLRELVGSVQLLRAKVSARKRTDNEIDARISDPVVNLFVISNHVSKNGWRLAKRSGVKILDIEKLSLLIADLGIQVPE